jgi:hypothetical protein
MFNERCSLDLGTETLPLSVWQWSTVVLTQQLKCELPIATCRHLYIVCLNCFDGADCHSAWSDLMLGVHTNICRVRLILVHTNQLQNGLASTVVACQLCGQCLIPGRPKYFFPLCHMWTGLVAHIGSCSSREWISFVWGKLVIAWSWPLD